MRSKLLTSTLFISSLFFNNSSVFAQKAKKGFVINGHISGSEKGTKIYLTTIKEQTFLDSCITDNGHFTFRGYVSRPTSCRIECGNEDAVIELENTTFQFTAPLKRMQYHAVITGGKEQDLSNQLHALQRPQDSLALLFLDSINNKLYKDKEDKKRLNNAYCAAGDSAQNIYVDFGKRHANSYLGLDILYRNRISIGKDTIRMLLAEVNKPLTGSAEAIGLHAFAYGNLAEKGQPFIDFKARTLEGEAFTLSGLKGRYILLNFWNPGCAPCLWEFKEINKHYNRLKDKLTIVSFNISPNKDYWAATSKKANIQWTNVSDLEGDNGKIKTQYNVQGIPTSYLINKEGIIVETFLAFNEDTFIKRIEEITNQTAL